MLAGFLYLVARLGTNNGALSIPEKHMLYEVTVYPPNTSPFSFNASDFKEWGRSLYRFETEEGIMYLSKSTVVKVVEVEETTSYTEVLAGTPASAYNLDHTIEGTASLSLVPAQSTYLPHAAALAAIDEKLKTLQHRSWPSTPNFTIRSTEHLINSLGLFGEFLLVEHQQCLKVIAPAEEYSGYNKVISVIQNHLSAGTNDSIRWQEIIDLLSSNLSSRRWRRSEASDRALSAAMLAASFARVMKQVTAIHEVESQAIGLEECGIKASSVAISSLKAAASELALQLWVVIKDWASVTAEGAAANEAKGSNSSTVTLNKDTYHQLFLGEALAHFRSLVA